MLKMRLKKIRSTLTCDIIKEHTNTKLCSRLGIMYPAFRNLCASARVIGASRRSLTMFLLIDFSQITLTEERHMIMWYWLSLGEFCWVILHQFACSRMPGYVDNILQ